MTRRNNNIDYHRGRTAYMITLKIEEGKQLLASLPKVDAATSRSFKAMPGMETVRPILTSLGEAMRQAWLTLPERFPEITIRDKANEWVIMPEHFHGILFINENMLEHLSDIEKLFKQRVMMSYRKLLIEGATEPVGQAREWLAAYQTLSADQQTATAVWVERQRANLYSATSRRVEEQPPFKVGATGSHSKQGFLFAPSYNDKPFWDEETLAQKQHYILCNAINRILRNGNPGWLKPMRGGVDTALSIEALQGYLRKECRPWQMTAPIWEGIERRILGSATGRRMEGRRMEGRRMEDRRMEGRRMEDRRMEDRRMVGRRMVDCDTYGNRALLERNQHRLLPLVCHRADKALRDKQRAAFLDAGQGAVVVSACINPDENALFKELIEAGYPAIKIEDNGFPEVYHPSEERQALCAIGRYLIVTPWKYEYRTKDATLEVAFCKTMNCVAQALCRTRDDWWKNGSATGCRMEGDKATIYG